MLPLGEVLLQATNRSDAGALKECRLFIATICTCGFLIGMAAHQSPLSAQYGPSVKIVGIGATTCAEFVQEAKSNPPSQRHYLAWMQGYLSGLVIGSPAGVDEGIDLSPAAFPLAKQLGFIRDYCLENPSQNFTDAVETLFKKLRSLAAT